ncbi:MAG: hypothetical protein CME70_23215 [Halobacteriovorax sp.]|nr:hypothetical protein [Halobacteriovorax sp.]|tara:strand:- start:80777 stop:81154 length:378 start_codon:yes stop_codon:yes gene_type:complete
MTSPQYIQSIVEKFYAKAVVDPIIGFHFRKIQEFEGDNPLRPPMEAFASHIPRIVNFWRMQLLGEHGLESEPFNLLKAHAYLGVKRAQVNRWLILFNETLDESEGDEEFITLWKQKAAHFGAKIR